MKRIPKKILIAKRASESKNISTEARFHYAGMVAVFEHTFANENRPMESFVNGWSEMAAELAEEEKDDQNHLVLQREF